jgi:NhaP-type Na+/H+ or K+/H+ antiporter
VLGWALGTDFQARFGVRLSHDLILLVLLPPLLFEGAATTNLESFQENLLTILVLAVPGLVISVILLGAVGQYVLGLPLILALLFGAMVLPTDPVSVLALFEEVGAPERLSTLVEGESLVNDSVGIVVFSTLLALVTGSSGTVTASDLLRPDRLLGVTADIAVTSVGGLAVGIAAGLCGVPGDGRSRRAHDRNRTDDHHSLWLLPACRTLLRRLGRDRNGRRRPLYRQSRRGARDEPPDKDLDLQPPEHWRAHRQHVHFSRDRDQHARR